MSNQSLVISIRALVDGLQQVKQLGQEMATLGTGAASAAASSSKVGAGIDALTNGASKASGNIAGLHTDLSKAAESFNSLTGYVKAAATAFVAFAAVGSIKSAADYAASVETLGVTLKIVGQNAGYSSAEISKYEEEVKKMGITTGAARESLIGMLQAGLPIGPMAEGAASNIAKLARMSQDLAVVTGKNSSDTLKALITNIQQLDTEGLRWMGIVVNMDEATQKYAEAHHKVAGALTSSEKQQALMNAAQEKGKLLSGAYEAALETVGKKLSSMQRYQQEASKSIGDSLLPAYTVIVDAATEFLKKVQLIAQGIADSGKVAEVLKNSVKGALDFAGSIISSLVGAVSKLAPVFESTFGKLKEAFSGLSSSGLIEFFDKLVLQATEFASVILEAIGNSAPSIRLLVDAFGLLMDTVGSIVTELFSFGEAEREAFKDGELLSEVLQTLGIFVAGFADGLQVVKGVAELMFGGLMIGLGGVVGTFGDLIGFILPAFGKEISDIGDKAIAMGFKSVEAAVKTKDAFADGNTNLAKYSAALEKLPAAHEADAEAASKANKAKTAGLAEAEELVRKYVRAVNDGKMTGEQAAEAYKNVTAQVSSMAAQYGFSQAQVEKLSVSLQSGLDKSDKTAAALKDLGITAQELGKGISESGAKGREAFNQLATSGKFTAAQLYEAFSKGLGMETSINGLNAFKQAADQAFKDGKASIQQYTSELDLVGAKFSDLFTKKLSTAKTQEDFKQLADSVRAAGQAGTISMDAVAESLNKISEKARGAGADLLGIAKQQTELSKESTAIDQAGLEVKKAEIEVSKTKRDVVKAELEYKRTGSEMDKATLDNAKAQEAVAEAKLLVSRTHYAEQLSAMDALIAKQASLNATQDLAGHGGDPVYEAKASAAERESKAAQLVAESTAQAAQQAERQLVATQSTSAATQAVVDNLKEEGAVIAGNAAMQAQADKNFSDGLLGIFMQINNSDKQMKALGFSTKEAAEIAATAKRDAFSTPPLDLGAAIDNLFSVLNNLANKAAEFREQMGKAMEFKNNYEEVAASAEHAEKAARGLTHEATYHSAVSTEISKVYAQIEEQAWKIADAATASSQAFINSAASIHEELLKAQGKEEEVALARYAQRQRELAVEYQLLDIKLAVAAAQAKAAGISTVDIENSRREAAAAFAQAKADLGTLQELEISKIKKTKEEQAAKDRQAKIDATERQRQEAAATVAKAATTAASNSSALAVAGARGASGILVESSRAVSVPTTNITINVDGKDLLSEDQIRRKIVPALNAISTRSR